MPDTSPEQITLALHIGAHKTATTHMQKTLQVNRKLLRDAGIVYYGPNYLRKPYQSPRHLFAVDDRYIDKRNWTGREKLEEMARGNARVVVSEENFIGALHRGSRTLDIPLYPKAVGYLSQLVENIAPHKLQIFLGVRDPAQFIMSAYSQKLFSGRPMSWQAYNRTVAPQDIDWSHLVRRITAIDGISKVFVWRYEDYHDVLRLIWRRMLRWKLGPMIDPFQAPLHQGLSVKAVEIALEWFEKTGDPKSAEQARETYPVSAEYPKFAPYDADALAASSAIYARDIDRIKAIKGVTVLEPNG